MKKIALLLFLFSLLGYSQNNQNELINNQITVQDTDESLTASPTQNSLEEQLKTAELMEMPNISVPDFILNLLITALLSFLLGYVY